jgi:putative aldouronate transport system substrate-binding protein
MRGKRKKVLSIMVAAVVTITTLSGFTTKSQLAKKSGDDKAPITFSYMKENLTIYPWTDSSIAKKLTENTGVTLDMQTTPDMNQKAPVMIAGDDYPELLEAGSNTQKFIDADVLLPLDDLINKYGPNIKKIWGASLNKLRNPNDGKIYFIGNEPRNRQGAIIDANQCLLIQYDVLAKAGYPKLKTLNDVYKVLKDYIAKVPTLKGKPFIPWGLWADTWGYNITLNNPAQWISGNQDDSDALVNQKDYSVKYFSTTNEQRAYLQFLNKLYNNNMMDKNAFITKNDQYVSQMSTGRVLAMIDGTWDVSKAEAALRQAGMPERCYARFPIVSDPSIKDRSQMDAESYSWGISITKNCKDPVRAIKFLDYCASLEGTILLNWGIKGVHYDVVNGKRVIKPEINKKLTEDPNYKAKEQLQYWNLGQLGGGYSMVKLDDGDYAKPNSPESVYANADVETKKVMDKYKIKYWGQMFNLTGKPNPYGFAWTLSNFIPQDSDAALAAKRADDYRHAFVPQIVMSKNQVEFNKNWNEFTNNIRNNLKIGTWETAMTKLIKDRLKLWKVVK